MMKSGKSCGLKAYTVTLCLAVCALLCLTGCHGSKGADAFVMPEEFDTGKNIEITFWAKNDTNKNQTDVYNQAIRNFEKLYPNVTVNMRLYTDYGRIYNDVITNISTNTTPDVCITYPDHIATYITGQNIVVPLDELMDNDAYGLGGDKLNFDGPKKDEIIPQFLKECKIGDTYYALPYMRSTEACYINKDLVEKLGYEVPDVLTWDYIWEVSEAAMKVGDDGIYEINGQNVLIPFIYKSTDNMMISMLKQLDAGYSDDDGNVLIFNDTTSDLLKEVAKHGKSGAFSTFKISSYPANFLDAGQCLFAIDSTAGATWMGSHAPLSDISPDKFVEFETVVRPIPQYDEANMKMISQGPSVCIFNKKDPQQVLAAWLFTQYLLTNEVQIGYATTEGYVPVTSKAQQSDEYTEYISKAGEDDEYHYDVKIAASKLLMDNVDSTFVTPVFNGSTSLRDAAGMLIENTVKGVRRNQTVDDAFINKLYSDVQSLYRLDQGSVAAGNSVGGMKASDLGPLPAAAKALIVCLIITWMIMGAVVAVRKVKK